MKLTARVFSKLWLFLAFLLGGLTLPLQADERILSYDSRIEVQSSGDLLVTETLHVRAEGRNIKRGIFRDIPRLQQSRWGLKKKKPFTVLSVERNGQPEPYEVESLGRGGLRIRIGRADVFIDRGEHTYTILYRTGKQLYVDDEAGEDALYWNAIGTEWDFPIDRATARLVLPDGIQATKHWAYTGAYEEQGEDYTRRQEANELVFEASRGFGIGEGMTVVARWPTGTLAPGAYAEQGSLWRDHPWVFLALLLMVAMLAHHGAAWFWVGKDPPSGVIIPRYAPPRGFSPAAVRYLDRMRFDDTCFSAAVVGLAAKGVVSIDQDDDEYTLKKTENEATEALLPEEKALFKKLLGIGSSVRLEKSNHERIGGARKSLQQKLAAKLEKTHFVRNLKWWLPGVLLSMLSVLVLVFATGESAPALFLMVWLSIWSVGTGVLVSSAIGLWRSGGWGAALFTTLFSLPFVAGWCLGCTFFFVTAGPWAGAALVLGGLVNWAFYHWIKAPTHLGRQVLDEIEGFRRYLAVAEEDRLNLANPPERTPELFEKFLPYALALGCEQEWGEQFDTVLQAAGRAPSDDPHRGSGPYRPSFYTGSGSGWSRSMGSALGGALTGALASSASAPSSSSSGGGGGGFSGGGGGGGGGGGW